MKLLNIPISWYIIFLLIIYILEYHYGIIRSLLPKRNKNNIKKFKLNTQLNKFNQMRDEIDKMLVTALRHDIADQKLLELTEYAVEGGKRVRGVIMLSAFRKNLEHPTEQHIVAISDAIITVEYIHCSSLILDDIMDEDDMRRGKLSLHTKHNIPIAQLVAVQLLTLAFKRLTAALETLKSLDNSNSELALVVLQEMSTKLNELSMGQYMDVVYAGNLPHTGKMIKQKIEEEQIRISTNEIIQKKTSSLFELSYLFAYLIINNSLPLNELNQSLNPVKKLANIFGMIFQIADDFEDYKQDQIQNGKNIVMNYPLNKGLSTAYSDYQSYVKSFNTQSKELNLNTEEIAEILEYLSEKVSLYFEHYKS